MKFLLAFATISGILGSASAKAYDDSGLFGTGKDDGSGFDPQYDIPPAAHVQSITCRWTTRLDYLAIKYDYYKDYNRYHERGTEFGRITNGKYSDTRYLTQANSITSLAPYICDAGRAIGAVCGLRFIFAHGDPMLCGIDESGWAHLPMSIYPEKSWHFHKRKFHSFFTTATDGGKRITGIGWTWTNS